MTLSADGWIDWADRSIPGHPAKVYSVTNSCKGFACHSVTGDLPNHAVPDRFLSDERVPGNPGRFTDYAAASVQFILYKDGHLRQLYPVTASTWTSGGPEANTSTMSMEAEGGYSPTTEPLTQLQEDTFCRLMKDLVPKMGVFVPGKNVWQHKELAAMYGYAPTACASDRYAHAWVRAAGEATQVAASSAADAASQESQDVPMTPAEAARLDRLEKIVIANGFDAICHEDVKHLFPAGTPVIPEGQDGTKVRLVGESALEYARIRGFSLGLAIELK